MELRQIIGNTWCLYGHQLIPLYRTDSTHCILLDTGASALRQDIVDTLEQNGLTPIGLLCTHTHFDHFGNARYLSERYHCPVALPLGEAEICRTLASVKSHLFVFTAGQVENDPEMSEIPCLVDHVIRPEETDTLFRGVRFRVLHTPGHAIDHVSYITPDNVCYIGDALMCGRTLHASRLPYAFNFRQSLETIEKLKAMGIKIEVGERSSYNTDKKPVRMEYLDDIDIPGFKDLPTFKRMCVCILKNDHACKYMGFSLTKKETDDRRRIMEYYNKIFS